MRLLFSLVMLRSSTYLVRIYLEIKMNFSFSNSRFSPRKFMAAMLLVLLSTFLHSEFCRAEPGDSCQVSDDCDEGERCKRGVCTPRQGRNPPNTGPNSSDVPGQRGGYICCDQYGNPRCQIGNGPQPMNSGCFCNGQGYGQICR